MARTTSTTPIFFHLLLLFHNFLVVSLSLSDAEILLNFKDSLENADALSNWNISKSPCKSWRGVLCENGHVWGLQLENMGLQGVIDVDTLSDLPNLRSISFKNNSFEGPLPHLTRVGALKTIFLSQNNFNGEIPPNAFFGMLSLKKLHLANNKLSGSIPSTLATLPRLIELTLQNNQFAGQLPNFQQDELQLQEFNASNNRLVGQIPQSLSHIDASSFAGNKGLCGAPLAPCPTKNTRLSVPTITVVAILVLGAIIALLTVVIVLLCCKKGPPPPAATAPTAAQGQQNKDSTTAAMDLDRMERGQAEPDQNGKQGGVRLTFLKEGVEKFDMQDLLKASAEILGSGVFGSTYKAALSGGKVMVVKRFKHMNNVSKEDFNEHMRRLGRLNHQNVLPIVAFYYRKEEKLLVADYAENVSLALRLHDSRSSDVRSLDWPTRLNIVKGVARGLLYLSHELPSLTAPHGHLKSSNVLLDSSYKPLLADYGLIPIVNEEYAKEHMISYKSPEYKKTNKITKKTEVWSLGMLILEILTGRSPSNDVDLATWVESAIHDESGGRAVVFDANMAAVAGASGEMMKLLNVGLSCCQADVDKRPDIKGAVEKIEEIKEKDFDDDFHSSYASDCDMRSSRALSEDFKSINI